jgi:hypothetical protein
MFEQIGQMACRSMLSRFGAHRTESGSAGPPIRPGGE